MKSLDYDINKRTRQLKHIPGNASEMKTDAAYIEAAASAIADIETIGKQLEKFTDDFNIRVAYNKLFSAYTTPQAKVNRSETHSGSS